MSDLTNIDASGSANDPIDSGGVAVIGGSGLLTVGALGSADDALVDSLYQKILFRSGSATDVSAWAGLLDSGQLTEAQAIAAFENSAEAVTYTDFVARMYQLVFNRLPDADGLSGWVNALRDGTVTETGLAQGFVGSAELSQDFSGLDATAFVTALYENALGRAPDAAGLAGWVDAINSGASLASVLLGFANSTEFVTKTTSGINAWLTSTMAIPGTTSAVDTITSGFAGVVATIGPGGGWNAATHAYDTGSETVNLTASANSVDTIVLNDGAIAIYSGSSGGITGFVVSPSNATADRFEFGVPKTVLANSAVSTAVSATDTSHEVAILNADLANLTWTSSNGVITFGAASGHSLTEFTSAQLMAAAEIIVGEAGGANRVAAFSDNGNTYVVTSDATGIVTTSSNGSGVAELLGVSGITGFGVTAAQGAIVDSTALNLTLANADHGGTALGASYDDSGFAADTLTNGAAGVTNSFTNLAPSAALTINGHGADLGNLATSQTGAAGANSLSLAFAGGATLESASISGDNEIFITPSGSVVIGSLVDPASTLATVAITSGAAVTLSSITDTALTVIDAHADNAGIIFGGWSFGPTTAIAPLTQAGLEIETGDGDNFVNASGAVDHIIVGNGANTIAAAGSGDVIAVGDGANSITTTGAGDTIQLGTGANTVTATGAGVTIDEAPGSMGGNQITVGQNAIVALSMTATGRDTIVVTGDLAGNPSSFGFTTISGAHSGTQIVLNNANGGVEGWLGNLDTAGNLQGNSATAASEVNVDTATTLTAAVNLAAAQAAAKNVTGAAPGTIAASTGIVDWFQFGGNTYLVEAANPTAAPASHNDLGASDTVVELVGLITPGNNALTNHTLTI